MYVKVNFQFQFTLKARFGWLDFYFQMR